MFRVFQHFDNPGCKAVLQNTGTNTL